MSFKDFLRGLGFGVIITAIIMSITYRINMPKEVNIVEEAKKIGMVFPKEINNKNDSEKNASQVAIDEKDSKKNKEANKKKNKKASQKVTKSPSPSPTASFIPQTASPKPSNIPLSTPVPEVTKVPEATKKPSKIRMSLKSSKKNSKLKRTINKKLQKFKVREGLLSSSVAREMREQGLIENEDNFDHYIENHGLGRKIKSGNYKIKPKTSFERLAQIITGN